MSSATKNSVIRFASVAAVGAVLAACQRERADYLAPGMAPAIVEAKDFGDVPEDASVAFLESSEGAYSVYVTGNVLERRQYLQDLAWDEKRTWARAWSAAVHDARELTVITHLERWEESAVSAGQSFMLAYPNALMMPSLIGEWVSTAQIPLIRFDKRFLDEETRSR